MASYLRKVQDLAPNFESFELIQISRTDNYSVNALLKLGSSKDSDLIGCIPVEIISKPSMEQDDNVLTIESAESWDGVIYKKGYSSSLLWCVGTDEANTKGPCL
ncbi:Uncharacterized protein Adt_35377 [Abeliophyllum distichum]|uniref:Uncharacterized protein n=1 Tax=Abeliophyllum distichum TaxID=126358 RepID=A0ABD1QIJ6_9LAMI